MTLPYDLRSPYARLLARLGTQEQRRWSVLLLLVCDWVCRYSVARVLREKKVFGLHPKEGTECAFDIAGPASGALLADAEVHCPNVPTNNCHLTGDTLLSLFQCSILHKSPPPDRMVWYLVPPMKKRCLLKNLDFLVIISDLAGHFKICIKNGQINTTKNQKIL